MAEFKITKLDDEKQLVFGFASVIVDASGEPLVDRQDDVIEPDELEKAAYAFMLRHGDGGEMHERTGVARIVESFVVTPEKLEKMGVAPGSIPCAWWIGMRIDDVDVWQRVKKGELRAFSIGGKGRRQKMEAK
jgi:hypothetical protein